MAASGLTTQPTPEQLKAAQEDMSVQEKSQMYLANSRTRRAEREAAAAEKLGKTGSASGSVGSIAATSVPLACKIGAGKAAEVAATTTGEMTATLSAEAGAVAPSVASGAGFGGTTALGAGVDFGLTTTGLGTGVGTGLTTTGLGAGVGTASTGLGAGVGTGLGVGATTGSLAAPSLSAGLGAGAMAAPTFGATTFTAATAPSLAAGISTGAAAGSTAAAGGGIFAGIGAALACIPVAGWIAIGVAAAGLATAAVVKAVKGAKERNAAEALEGAEVMAEIPGKADKLVTAGEKSYQKAVSKSGEKLAGKVAAPTVEVPAPDAAMNYAPDATQAIA